mgnify:CR=1 FL=1
MNSFIRAAASAACAALDTPTPIALVIERPKSSELRLLLLDVSPSRWTWLSSRR